MTNPTTYSTRSAAIRAAKAAARRALGPQFQPYEGPDFEIHPDGGLFRRPRFYYRLTPAFFAGVAQAEAEAVAEDGWNPRPVLDGTAFNDRAYLCGYTDGFFGCDFGSHDAGQYGAFSAYRPGFSDGRSDANGGR